MDGLEVLGTNDYDVDEDTIKGVFQESALERVELPLTLQIIFHGAFADCENLKSVRLPERLKYVGKWSFSGCQLENVSFPARTAAINVCAFFGNRLR